MIRNAEGMENMTLGLELGEESTLNDIPVPLKPSTDQFWGAGGAQSIDVLGVVLRESGII